MATTKWSATTLRNKINLAVQAIGTTNDTKRPPTAKMTNRSGIAYDLAVAKLVKTRAEALYRSAVKAAIEAGVMFDHTKKPLRGGLVKELYRDEVVRVYVKTSEPHARLNMTTLRDIMTSRYRISFTDFDAAIRAAMDKTNPPHEFSADIVSRADDDDD